MSGIFCCQPIAVEGNGEFVRGVQRVEAEKVKFNMGNGGSEIRNLNELKSNIPKLWIIQTHLAVNNLSYFYWNLGRSTEEIVPMTVLLMTELLSVVGTLFDFFLFF